jgi:N-glycosylase/DNA lyase
MPTHAFTLKCPRYYSLKETCHAHGWHELAPFSWDAKRGELRTALFAGTQAVDVLCVQDRNQIALTVTSHERLSPAERDAVAASMRRCLDLDRDIAELLAHAKRSEPEFEKLLRGGAGRMLRAPTLWEDAAKTLYTTNCTWGLTIKMAQASCAEAFAPHAPSGARPFPAPDAFARHTPAKLKAMIPAGYRAAYLHALAIRFASDADSVHRMETSDMPVDDAYELAKGFFGFGPYAASHLLVMAGHFGRIPVDTVVTSFLKKAYRVRKVDSFITRHYGPWGRQRWWAMRLDQIRHHRRK